MTEYIKHLCPNIKPTPSIEELQTRPYKVFDLFADIGYRGLNLIEFYVEGKTFRSVDFSFANLSCLVFSECLFECVCFHYAFMYFTSFEKCTFLDSDFSGSYRLKFSCDTPLSECPVDGLVIPPCREHYWPIIYYRLENMELIFSNCLRSDSLEHFSQNTTLNYSAPHYLEDIIAKMEEYACSETISIK
jgi:hypothetical protein